MSALEYSGKLDTPGGRGKHEVWMTRLPPKAPLSFDPLRFVRRIVLSEAERRKLIAEAAYLRAASRHFEPGHEVDDWLSAERAVNAQFGDTARQLPDGN